MDKSISNFEKFNVYSSPNQYKVKGLHDCNSPMCTLSQNGYSDTTCQHLMTLCFTADPLWAPCHDRLWSVVDHAKSCPSMKMEVPGLADSLQQYLCVSSGIYADEVLDTDPGWQQSKLIWALSAEAGLASRMRCTDLWHDKATQQPFCSNFSLCCICLSSCFLDFGLAIMSFGMQWAM